jgi:hypothetical protein
MLADVKVSATFSASKNSYKERSKLAIRQCKATDKSLRQS